MEMRIVSWICFAIALAPAVPSIFGAEKPETSRLAFVAEYIRELAAIQNIRTFVGHEIRQGKEAEKSAVVADVLYAGTLVQLELRSQIARLESMRLNPPFDDLIPKLTAVYRLKVHWCQKLIDNGKPSLAPFVQARSRVLIMRSLKN